MQKNYQALIEDRIFFGGASDVEDMVKNEGVEVSWICVERLRSVLILGEMLNGFKFLWETMQRVHRTYYFSKPSITL